MDPGTRLGPYEIVQKIGAGGMGEVYRARDTRLGRDVAVKTIPAAVASNPERRTRFEREARILAALNHPNVGAIYGIEDADGAPALVLELVDGETLHERLHAGGGSRPLPLDEAVAIARQIAEALEAAHEKGIVHRDLKPANVKVTPAGVVKVLDFGLGRVVAPESPDSTSDPTATSGGTLAGAVVGTAGYMSPEQARGGLVDRRTDVWAFGCVLFEMLTGVRAFGGDTLSDTLVQVIAREPEWSCLGEDTPAALRRLLRRCLQKDLRRRLHDIADARLELEELRDEETAAAAALPRGRAGVEVRLLRLTDSLGTAGAPAVSPDGKMVAFVATSGGRRQIFVRLLAGGAPLQLTRDDADHDAPRWTADSSALVYHVPNPETGGNLWRISALGGPPRRVTPALGGADVSPDGRRLAFFRRAADGTALVVAALDGSAPRALLTVPPEFAGEHPRFSPDGRLIAWKRTGLSFDARIEVVDVASGELRTAMRASWLRGHAWLPDGSGLVYGSSAGSTMAYPPTSNLRLVGRDGGGERQLTFGDISWSDPDVDAAGRLLAARSQKRSDVWSFPVDGAPRDNVANATRVTQQAGEIQVPGVSPDGQDLVYVSDTGGHSNLWVAAIDGSSCQQITFESDPAVAVALPLWEPGGERILFLRAHAAVIDVCIVGRDGGAVETLVPGALGPCWSADGRSLYFSRETGRIERLDVGTGAIATVRADRAIGPALPRSGGVLFYARLPELLFAPGGQTEVCRAAPEDGPSEVLARVASSRVPLAPRILLHTSASPDGRWLAAPLLDGQTVNVWLIPTDGAPMRPITDFGERPVFIARQVSWSPDSRRVYAAVADNSADIVLLEGLLG